MSIVSITSTDSISEDMQPKSLKRIVKSSNTNVGDGFEVQRAFPNSGLNQPDPFLLLDHIGPVYITPTEAPKGVAAHPHRGFETVTIIFDGALEHKDSLGNHGKLQAGDVQWMTAASGIIHEEKHERAFAQKGGLLEMIQIWVNLPAHYKMSRPNYQDIRKGSIPKVKLPKGGELAIIAGEYQGKQGPARTFTPLRLWSVELPTDGELSYNLPDGWINLIYCLSGSVAIYGEEKTLKAGETAVFTLSGEWMKIKANNENTTKLLILSGEPIRENIVSFGPFVMNTTDEINQAIQDFHSGNMGKIKYAENA